MNQPIVFGGLQSCKIEQDWDSTISRICREEEVEFRIQSTKRCRLGNRSGSASYDLLKNYCYLEFVFSYCAFGMFV